MDTYQTFTLKQITTGIFDCPHSTPKWTDEGVLVIRNFNIKNGQLKLDDPSFTDQLTYIERTKRAIPSEGDLILTREAPMGEICMVPEGLTCCLGQRVVLIRPDKKKIYPKYLLYKFQSAEIQNQIKMSEGTGSVVSNLRIPHIENLNFKLPEYEIQKKSADILSSFDHKIELNRRMNQTLEQIAATLFKKYFIDDIDPNNLPNDWRTGELRELVDLVKVPIPLGERDKYKFYLPVDCLPQKSMALTTCNDISNANSSLVEFKENDILFGAMRSYFHKVLIAPFYGLTRTTCFVLRPRFDFFLSYAYLLLFQDETVAFSSQVSQGSTIPYAVWQNGLDKMPCIIPSSESLQSFDSVVYPILSKLKKSFFENRTLHNIRDNLLPKLMSGEIDLSAIHQNEQLHAEVLS